MEQVYKVDVSQEVCETFSELLQAFSNLTTAKSRLMTWNILQGRPPQRRAYGSLTTEKLRSWSSSFGTFHVKHCAPGLTRPARPGHGRRHDMHHVTWWETFGDASPTGRTPFLLLARIFRHPSNVNAGSSATLELVQLEGQTLLRARKPLALARNTKNTLKYPTIRMTKNN